MRGDRLVAGGILLIDKPSGISSAKAVAVAKRALGRPRIGHLGTLDPFASGLLPLCVGEGTKLAPYLSTADKRYRGVIRLGVTTDTLDATGTVFATATAPDPATLDLARLAAAFCGVQQQVPPAFSAIKRGGTPAYKLARTGEAPSLPSREVVIHELALERVDRERLGLSAHCSKGTYIRGLARDIGARVGCGGMLEELVRTGFGPFLLADAVALRALEGPEGAAAATAAMIAPAAAVGHLPLIRVDRATAASLRAGRQQALATCGARVVPAGPGARARVVDAEQRLVAVVCEGAGRWKIDRVFREVLDDPC